MKRTCVTTIGCLLIIMTLSSCGWSRRRDLEISPFNQIVSVQTYPSIMVKFEESILGKPLNETVWDNVSGPFWDIEESHQIGFTQHYKPLIFAIPPAFISTAAQSGAHLVDSRLVIPFGNIFSTMFTSAVRKYFPTTEICFDDGCLAKASSPERIIIKVDNFSVWEAPLNHLNLYAKGMSTHYSNGRITKQYNFEKQQLSMNMGSVFMTHRTLIKNMNRASNNFAEELTTEILQKGL